jgi:hypothetical protein
MENNNKLSKNIKESQIENIQEISEYLKYIICYVCLEIPSTVLECSLCESIICEDCNLVLSLAKISCAVTRCKGSIKKANKFVRDILSKLKIKCEFCKIKKIEHKDYLKHLQDCVGFQCADLRKINLINELKEKSSRVERLSERVGYIKQNSKFISVDKNPAKKEFYNKDQIREALMTFNLSSSKKKELYNTTIQGDLKEFKKLIIDKKFPLFEEISAKDYYWTSFHYAMHYGHIEIILFIFEYLRDQKILDMALLLFSSDDRCPIMCLLKSNQIDNEKKKNILSKIQSKFKIKMSDPVKDELRRRLMNDLLTR